MKLCSIWRLTSFSPSQSYIRPAAQSNGAARRDERESELGFILLRVSNFRNVVDEDSPAEAHVLQHFPQLSQRGFFRVWVFDRCGSSTVIVALRGVPPIVVAT